MACLSIYMMEAGKNVMMADKIYLMYCIFCNGLGEYCLHFRFRFKGDHQFKGQFQVF